VGGLVWLQEKHGEVGKVVFVYNFFFFAFFNFFDWNFAIWHDEGNLPSVLDLI